MKVNNDGLMVKRPCNTDCDLNPYTSCNSIPEWTSNTSSPHSRPDLSFIGGLGLGTRLVLKVIMKIIYNAISVFRLKI